MDQTVGDILVIGGSSGIGQAIVNRLSVPTLEGQVFSPSVHMLDVCDAVDIIREILVPYSITHCVYSAGINELAYIQDIDYNSESGNFKEILDVNVVGFARIIAALKQDHPIKSIVAITSDAAERPMRGSLMYCASKAALNMAIKCAARELAPRTRVNGIAPGMTDGTQMQAYIDSAVPSFRGWTPEQARAYETSQIPMGRRATTDEIAEVTIATLFGPEYLSGAIIPVNGGR